MNKEHTLIRLVDDDESLLFSTKILLEVNSRTRANGVLTGANA